MAPVTPEAAAGPSQRHNAVPLLGCLAPASATDSGTSQEVPIKSCAAVPASPNSLNYARVVRSAVSLLNEPPLSASGGSKCLGGPL